MERHRRQEEEENNGVRHLPVVFVVDAPFPRLPFVELDVRLDNEHGNRRAQADLEPLVRNVRTAEDGVVDAKLVQAPDGSAHDCRALHLVIGVVGWESPYGLDRWAATIGICACLCCPLPLPPVVQEAGRLHVGVVATAHLISALFVSVRLRESSWSGSEISMWCGVWGVSIYF